MVSFALASTTIGAAPRDPTARGIDVFVHAPEKVAAGGRLPVQVRVFGFPKVSTLEALAGARVEAAWDPESLGDDVAAPPPAVTATADDAGRAHLEIDVPKGKAALKLLVTARWHDHARTREIAIERLVGRQLDLRISDTAVAPGAAVGCWVFIRDIASGLPLINAPVDIQLKEGLVSRFSRRVSTDQAGTAALRVPVPFTDDPDWRWHLTARTAFGTGDDVESGQELRVREETPGNPSLSVKWSADAAPPGTHASFQVQVRDGTGAAIAGLPLRYWLAAKGLTPPKDDAAWQRLSTAAATDGDGNVSAAVDLPSMVARRGSGYSVMVKAAIAGRTLLATDTLALETPTPRMELVPEFGELLPGVTQRLFLHASVGTQPLSAAFAVEGHGLVGSVRTNDRGWGQLTWNVPREIGAHVPRGAPTGCAGVVAATVRVRPAAAQPGPMSASQPVELCVSVNRDAVATVQPSNPLVRAGEPVQVHLVGRSPANTKNKATNDAISILLAQDAGVSAAGWLPPTSHSGAVAVPAAAHGLWTISAAPTLNRASRDRKAPGDATGSDSDSDDDNTRDTRTLDPFEETGPENPGAILAGKVLVIPRVLPKLSARVATGQAPPADRAVVIEADLRDGHGGPLLGTVGAVVIDKHGGANPQALLALDTRRAAVADLNVAPDDADAFLEGDARFDIERWAMLARATAQPTAPAIDPAATVDAELERAFAAVVRSLEGGVFQSSGDPERLRDVRIRTAGGFALNPEMLTLATEAMQTPPVTPGGEPWRLADLMAIDRQVTYDHVARRVTRLKLFRVLAALRTFVHENKLGPDEPILSDPNALLRRLVARRKLAASGLVDPWGNGLSFVRSAGPRVPFLSMIPGYRLLSAGPDGRFGTTDDVRDPFQRVLASNTRYARAVKEDRIVDARWDMQVGDDTVESWKTTLETLTGMALGDQESEPETGVGTGALGNASGYGSGGGGLGGRRALTLGPADWVPPMRTDEHGHVRLTVPLRDADTTWQVLLVGVPDQGTPAVTSLDVPVSTGLSVSVNAGARWIIGDRVGVAVALHNRTESEVSAVLHVAASGTAALVEGAGLPRTVKVAPRALASVIVPVLAAAVGTGALDATVSAPGLPASAAHAEWPIEAAGEAFVSSSVAWVERQATVTLPASSDGDSAAGPTRLVMERGIEPALAAVLDALSSERLTGLRGVADALEVFARVRAWALVRGGQTDPLAVRALHLAGLALARKDAIADGQRDGVRERPLLARLRLWEGPATSATATESGKPSRKSSQTTERLDCPPPAVVSVGDRLDWLEAPARVGSDGEAACWPAFVTSTLQQPAATADPLSLARLLLAVRDRPAQAMVTGALADRLRAAVPVQPDGSLGLPAVTAADRAARSIVMAALVRARTLGTVNPTTAGNAARLTTRLLTERDATGGYGSVLATRLAVRALLESAAPATDTAAVQWIEVLANGRAGAEGRTTLASKTIVVPLSAAATGVRLTTTMPGVVARIERPILRSFRRAPGPTGSPLSLQIEAPSAPTAGATSLLQVGVRHDLNRRAPVVVRVPLPPGATLAEKVDGVRQVQGALYIKVRLDADPLPRVTTIPLHFSLSGTVTLPEAVARVEDEELPPVRAPARPLVMRPRK